MQRTIEKGALRSEKKALKASYLTLYEDVAKANRRNLLSDVELRQFKAFAKRVVRVNDVGDARALRQACSRKVEDIHKRLADLGELAGATDAQQKTLVAPAVSLIADTIKSSADAPIDAALEKHAAETTKLRIVRAILSGERTSDALQTNGIKPTPTTRRWAQRVVKTYRRHETVQDRRPVNTGRPVSVVTPEMSALIHALWMRYRNATASAIVLAITEHIEKTKLAIRNGDTNETPFFAAHLKEATVLVPSVQAVQKAIRSFGPAEKLLRTKGNAEYFKQIRLLGEMPETKYGNQVWEVDHTPLDIWTKELVNGQWIKSQPHLTVLIDVHSRAIPNFIVSHRVPDSNTSAMLLRGAILPIDESDRGRPTGLPEILLMDNGKDFRSVQTAQFCNAVKIDWKYNDPHSPDQKPHVERFFKTLQDQLLPLLPGYKHARDRGSKFDQSRIDRFLTIVELRKEIEKWIYSVYQQRIHSTTKQKPMEHWLSSTPFRELPSQAQLNMLLLYRLKRRVTRGYVRLKMHSGSEYFWGESLLGRDGQTLTLRFNPDDTAVVYAYSEDDKQFLGELKNREGLENGMMREGWRSAFQEKKSLIKSADARVQQYHEQSQVSDRASKATLQSERLDAQATVQREKDTIRAAADAAEAERLDAEFDRMLSILGGESGEAQSTRTASANDEESSEFDDLMSVLSAG